MDADFLNQAASTPPLEQLECSQWAESECIV